MKAIKDSPLKNLLSACLQGYEHRPEQEAMYNAVAGNLLNGSKLLIEAGTGTGKSLAYLIPLCGHALENESRCAVSTYTKALQRQLIEKDLPFIRDNIFPELRFALSLGSENYLCLRRLEKAKERGLFDDSSEQDRLLHWADATTTGIREGFSGNLWSNVSRESDLCLMKYCKRFRECFYQKAKEKERQSHLLVLNHHLFFADLSSEHRVLPRFDNAVFDEAHELEDVASAYLSTEVSNIKIRRLLNAILNPRGRGALSHVKGIENKDLSRIAALLNTIGANSDIFFAELSLLLEAPAIRIRRPGAVADNLSAHLMTLNSEMDMLKDKAADDEERKELGALSLRCRECSDSIVSILNHSIEECVYWAERSGRVIRMSATPIDIAGLNVFDGLQSTAFTSATLAGSSGFDYIKERLGLIDAEELALNSHFDYKRQAVLYVASELPQPNTPDYEQKAIERISRILRITGGRTLVLFTSHSMLNMACDEVYAEGVRILKQGDKDNYALVEEFRADPASALFGTYTFWQGIDVPGDALKCVIITKLPFTAPDEPVAEARMERLKENGKDPFMDYQMPRAVLMLRQGFGRLIRTSSDSGTVAILDSRIGAKWYGRVFLKALPDMRITSDIQDLYGLSV